MKTIRPAQGHTANKWQEPEHKDINVCFALPTAGEFSLATPESQSQKKKKAGLPGREDNILPT